MIILSEFIDTKGLLGKSIKVYLKEGGIFFFKVTGAGINYISGFDSEMIELHIKITDIDFIIEGEK